MKIPFIDQKHVFSVMVFTFAVMMVVLRPFFAYHLVLTGHAPKEPGRISRMLSGLVKKKNETHGIEADESSELDKFRKFFYLPVVLCLLLRRVDLLLATILPASPPLKYNTVFHVSPSNQYYQFICRLQV